MKLPRIPTVRPDRRAVVASAVFVTVALLVFAAVWVLNGFWSFTEQADAAERLGFDHPALAFWISDGLQIGGAFLALAAAIDNRASLGGRVSVLVGAGLSAWFNTAGAIARLGGIENTPLLAWGMAAGAPIVSFGALEVLTRAIRTLVRRWRGDPAPVAVPALRVGRLLLDGKAEFRTWRLSYLAATRPGAVPTATVDDLRGQLADTVRGLIPPAVDEARIVRTVETALLDSLRPHVEAVADDIGNLRAEIAARPQQSPVEVTARDLALVRASANEALQSVRELPRLVADAVRSATPRTTLHALPGPSADGPAGGRRTSPASSGPVSVRASASTSAPPHIQAIMDRDGVGRSKAYDTWKAEQAAAGAEG